MKITAKVWTIIGAIVSIIGLIVSLMSGKQDGTNPGTQNVVGHDNTQIQGNNNNVDQR